MAQNFYHDSIDVEAIVYQSFYHDFIGIGEIALDIDNDFRMVYNLVESDINNDFRLTGATLNDILNDFRITLGNTVLSDINNKFTFRLEVLYDILNKIAFINEKTYDIANKFTFVTEPTLSDVTNLFNLIDQTLSDINNDIRTQKEELNNITNDFRLIADWQIPGDIGFQSLGKTYIKIYINTVEQTDANIDSASINKVLNGTHIATFDLGRAYDSTKPDMEAVVEIKYNDQILYKGYIVDISPTDSPESIRISCNDKFWKQNKTKKYFHIGHKPQDDKDLYYDTIKEGLSSECSFSVDVGNFIPQTINCFGQGESDCINSLIPSAGNYAWFYKEDESKKLWEAGKGDIINIEAQSIGINLGLHQILRHQFRENIENIVNKLRVQMGETIIRTFDDTGGAKTYSGYTTRYFSGFARPAWNSSYEVLAKNTILGYGWDYHQSEDDEAYKDVFKKYYLPYLDSKLESYSDRYPPKVEIYEPGTFPYGFRSGTLTEGFTIDYENKLLIFNEPLIFYDTNTEGEATRIRRAGVKLLLFKNVYYSYTFTPSEDPEVDESNPLMFITDKIGTYSETIIDILDLSSFSVQEGIVYTDPEGNEIVIPSWDDTNFAKEYAYWQLSNTAYKKVTGSIDITLDTFLFYGIDLSKRIIINGVINNPLNINSITINLNDFRVTLELESRQEYRRTVSLPSHGE